MRVSDPKMPLVAVVMGSGSDAKAMQGAADVLSQLGIEHEVVVVSAHRTPERAREYAMNASERGIEVIIAGAGLAAHLPGVLASWTTLPVIGVPLASGELRGLDALYSIVQMPPGVPVACMGIGAAGARNAAFMAAAILSLKYEHVRRTYEEHRRKLAEG